MKKLIYAMLLTLLPHVALAQAPALGPSDWSEGTQTLLAAAVVGESGWQRVTDHDALPWLLYNRWRDAGGSFEEMILQYCKALTGKRPWLLELNSQGVRPPLWPANASWARHRDKWLAIHDRIGAWARGEVPNPCPNAVHFGGGMDPRQGRMIPARCAGSVNRFWKLREKG
jgi:hypothetical protein